VKKLLPILGVVVLWPAAASWAQLAPPNAAGVTMGHVHIVARDVVAEKKVWVGLGGAPISIDGTDVIKFPGIFIFISQGVPAYSQGPASGAQRIMGEFGPEREEAEGRPGPPARTWTVVPAGANNEGNVLSHVGFRVQPGKGIVEKMQAMGLRVAINDARYPDEAEILSTENMRIATNNAPASQKEMIVADLIQFDLPRYSRRRALAWYAKLFGVKALPGGEGMYADMPGLPHGLAFGREVGSPDAPKPSMGHTLDHIGFEVANLEAFCKKLEGMGILFEYPYSKTRTKSFASAAIVDPWGAFIELTEGLSRF